MSFYICFGALFGSNFVFLFLIVLELRSIRRLLSRKTSV